MSVFQEEPGDLFGVPEEYHDLRAVFSRSRATSLPPHRPYDCSIELLPGTMPPRGRLYSLSAPERGALENYLTESLAAGIIVPSSSPAGAGFFFVKKKDGSLRPCIDYRGLNDITVKNRYPLPLMSSAFEILQGAKVFTKLDLRNAYHLVCIVVNCFLLKCRKLRREDQETSDWIVSRISLLRTQAVGSCSHRNLILSNF